MSDHEGRAARGSQYWLQKLVNEQPELLNRHITNELNSLEGKSIEWLSPLASENFSEYRDQVFLEKLGIDLPKRALSEFWPAGGPVWDGLARTDVGDLILVEAKSHIPEAVSPPSRASPRSLELIRASLDETKNFLKGNPDADRSGTFYQYTNRLAHLYLLRELNQLPAWLVFIYFVGDTEMNGPDTDAEWKGATKTIETYLGVTRSRFSPYLGHVYLDVRSTD